MYLCAQFINDDDRKQKLFTKICHALWHVYGNLLDIEIHIISVRISYTLPFIIIRNPDAGSALHRLPLREDVSG